MCSGGRSKTDALRLVRKLVIVGVLLEETFRQDNEYGAVGSTLKVAEGAAKDLASGALKVIMPFLASGKPEKAGPSGQRRSDVQPSTAKIAEWEEDDIYLDDIIEDAAEERTLSPVRACLICNQQSHKSAFLVWPSHTLQAESTISATARRHPTFFNSLGVACAPPL